MSKTLLRAFLGLSEGNREQSKDRSPAMKCFLVKQKGMYKRKSGIMVTISGIMVTISGIMVTISGIMVTIISRSVTKIA